MKVILVNGSPHERGCTDRALREVAAALESEGVQTEMLWIGRQPGVHGLRRVPETEKVRD